ncbi:hypothetical protein [Cyanobium gracile]|uniref:Uncharacterized protein n=1 Tax=Cyanobium gracile (strain ATCC 27147 / PCC 6307) TaxID=292564 RepID=K9P4N1_CYAGP|nr:hypothetical protein [Cyanobium gracile]AFY28070.1 hypothetical protein Cyagr_0886 [Cyanobium gracile PCC 6307]
MVNAPETRPEETVRQKNCLGRTCMKWSANGELTDLDLQLILMRLIAVDDQAAGLLD